MQMVFPETCNVYSTINPVTIQFVKIQKEEKLPRNNSFFLTFSIMGILSSEHLKKINWKQKLAMYSF